MPVTSNFERWDYLYWNITANCLPTWRMMVKQAVKLLPINRIVPGSGFRSRPGGRLTVRLK